MKRPIFVLLLICSLFSAVEAKRNNNVRLAPLPAPILQAKTVFLANGGGSDVAYDSFQQAIKTWNHFRLVDSPDKADLVFRLSYSVVDGGAPVFSTDSSTGQNQVLNPHNVDLQVRLTVYDGRTHRVLLSTLQHRDLASRQKNREKNTIQAAEMLVQELRNRVEITSSKEMLVQEPPHNGETIPAN